MGCAPAPIGEVGGITTMRVMPAKVPLPMVGPWQAAQLLVMPAWLMREPENFAPLGTGSVGTLEPVPTWQTSQEALVGMWLEGRPTMLVGRGNREARRGGAVALRAVGGGAGRVGVDVGQRRHHRVVAAGVAGRALRRRRGRDVVGRLVLR